MKIKNAQLLPLGIEEKNIEEFHDRIVAFINRSINPIGFMNWDENELTIEISNKRPKTRYIGYDLSAIKRGLIKKLQESSDASHITNLINKINDSENNSELLELSSPIAEHLASYYESENARNNYKSIKTQIEDLVKMTSFETDTLGCYTYDAKWDISNNSTTVSDPKIILYIRNIEKNSTSYGGLLQALEAAMSHEYFHWYHHLISREHHNLEFEQRHDYLSNIIKESFADYFCSVYCEYNMIIFDENHWYDHSVRIFPYSGATFITDFYHFKKLFHRSLDVDMQEILQRLIDSQPKKLYFDIINHDHAQIINYTTRSKIEKDNTDFLSTKIDELEKRISKLESIHEIDAK